VIPAPPMESHNPPQSLSGFMNQHRPIIAPRHPETIRTSPLPESAYIQGMNDSPVGTDWTFTILASVVIIAVTLTVLIVGYINLRSL
jgi:hypothetical protein